MNAREKPDAVKSALAQAGLRQAGFRAESLVFREIDNRSMFRLRALPDIPGTAGAIGDLPLETGQCAGDDPVVLCLRPGEWLVVSKEMPSEALNAHICAHHDPAMLFAWDESDALAVLRIEGAAADWLLRKHCGLDIPLDPGPAAKCAQTKFAHISVLIHWCVDQPERACDIYVERSLARYLWELLADSAPHAIEMQAQSGKDGAA